MTRSGRLITRRTLSLRMKVADLALGGRTGEQLGGGGW
jgi:hypothetical protein